MTLAQLRYIIEVAAEGTEPGCGEAFHNAAESDGFHKGA